MRTSRTETALFLAGPAIWAVHFFLLYGAHSFIAFGMPAPLAATALALASLAILVFARIKALKIASDDRVFLLRASIALAGLSAIGIAWTSLPMVLAS